MSKQLFIIIAILAIPALGKTTAERLGYGVSDKILIIGANDLGRSDAVDRAILDAAAKGAFTSASLMIPGTSASAAATAARGRGLDVGLHTTVTSDWDLFRPLEKVPSLVDTSGNFWKVAAEGFYLSSVDEFEKELRSQLKRARALGLSVTHLDSHAAEVYFREDFREVLLKVGKEQKIPPLLAYRSAQVTRLAKELGVRPEDIAAVLKSYERKGYVLLDELVESEEIPGNTPAERRKGFEAFFRGLKPGVTQLLVDVAYYDSAKLAAIAKAGGKPQVFADWKILCEPAMRSLLDSLGVKRIDWRGLQAIAF